MNENERKRKSAERLFDSMGMIDDVLVAEASSYAIQSRIEHRAFVFRRFVAVAAAVLLLTVGMAGAWVISKTANSDGDVYEEDLNEQIGTPDKLKSTLQTAFSDGVALRVSPDAILSVIDFFNGRTMLIWQYEGEGDYYVVECDNTQSLKKEMSRGGEQISREDSENVGYKIWVSYGNGEVVTPHLKENAGNVGYAELFEYSPEIIPNEGFEKVVNETVFN